MAKQQPVEQPAAEGEGAPVKSKKKLLILIGAAFLALLLSAGGAAFFLMGGEDEPAAEAENVTPGKQVALYQPMDPAFVVNYTHENRRRFMQVSVVLMGRDAEKMAAVSQHMPLLRNELVLQFSSEEFSSLFSPEGKESLRQRATLSVQSILEKELGDPVIESVLFTNIVLQ